MKQCNRTRIIEHRVVVSANNYKLGFAYSVGQEYPSIWTQSRSQMEGRSLGSASLT